MDWLGRYGAVDRFVLFGLCSGADNALATASADERVAGLVLLDPPTYATMQARVRNLFARLRRLASPGAVAARVARLVGQDEESVVARRSGRREVPSVSEYRAVLTALVERGIPILAIFAGGLEERYNHPDQLFELFPELRGRIDRAFFPAANHTYTEVEAQAALVTTVIAWIELRR
jgi:pimeloyl-ACP methyl ester carboxylesterase